MKKAAGKFLALALIAAIGLSVATPARADWYDGHHWHHGHVARGWHYDRRLHYYVYGTPVVVAPPPPAAYVYAPPPPPVIVTQPAPQVVYAAPQPYYAPAPVGLSLGVHIR